MFLNVRVQRNATKLNAGLIQNNMPWPRKKLLASLQRSQTTDPS